MDFVPFFQNKQTAKEPEQPVKKNLPLRRYTVKHNTDKDFNAFIETEVRADRYTFTHEETVDLFIRDITVASFNRVFSVVMLDLYVKDVIDEGDINAND